jgi:hydrogenase maturation protease
MGNGKDNIRVICCGNPFKGDDGVGIEVFRLLEKETFPEHVEIIEGGILGINLLFLFNGCNKIILVDSVIMDKPPGHIQWFTMADVLETKPAKISSHEINPAQLMRLWHQQNPDLAFSGILLLGIVISEPMHLTDMVSPEIQQSALTAADEIKRKIRSFLVNEKY